jgi:hypothetical protein
MYRKILGICTALIAFGAFAILPAMASASPVLTEKGTVGGLPTGTKITATNTGDAIFQAGSLSVKCNENWLTGTVVKNNGSEIEGTIENAKFQASYKTETRCDGGELLGATRVKTTLTNEGGKTHWCIKSTKTADQWELLGAGCGSAGELTFILEGNITCSYKRSGSVGGTFTTNEEPAKLTVTGEPEFVKDEGSFLCPASGKITTMVFDLYTDVAEDTKSPLFIS